MLEWKIFPLRLVCGRNFGAGSTSKKLHIISNFSRHYHLSSWEMGGDGVETFKQTDCSSLTNEQLLARVTELERQLSEQTRRLRLATTRTPSPRRSKQKKRPNREFDASKYSTRHIALKIAYLGQRYNGFEHANGNVTALPTIEEMLWKALRKARLISPPSDESTEVSWSYTERLSRPLLMNWEGCQYSKCGRTDKGVSAFGQVIGIRVRSNRPTEQNIKHASEHVVTNEFLEDSSFEKKDLLLNGGSECGPPQTAQPFDSIVDELPYISILNAILPNDIRILAWCPHPPDDFDARFSCGERRYKYFFTNPAFLPTASTAESQSTSKRMHEHPEGWLDIDAMRNAAQRLLGLHDFRNFCRIDPTRQLTKFDRVITHVSIDEVQQQHGPTALTQDFSLSESSSLRRPISPNNNAGGFQSPRVYSFTVHGSAFLWHQVRHMIAVLFLIGQGLEPASTIDRLLDIETNPSRPTYGMASDGPLVLWDCTFPQDKTHNSDDSLNWVYASDARILETSKNKGDRKHAASRAADSIWSIWRKHKINEILASSLLDLVVSQEDKTRLPLSKPTEAKHTADDRPKIFDGSETPRLVGRYIPVMELPTVEPVEVQNAKYCDGKGSRRELRRALERNGG